eukprot:183210_1
MPSVPPLPTTTFCDREFGDCVSKSYAQYYQNLSASLLSLPNRDRLLSSPVSTATREAFNLSSMNRLSLDHTFDRKPLLEPTLLAAFETGCVDGTCEGCVGGTCYNPRQGGSGMSRIILVPDYNDITFEFPMPALAEPYVCNLQPSFSSLLN